MERTRIAHTLTNAPFPVRIARRVADLWCTLMHDSLMWPIHGLYECRTCGRRQAVAWAPINAIYTPAAEPLQESLAGRFKSLACNLLSGIGLR
jgi:hypothetical protein